jgi:hypothetical protein
MEAVGSGVRVSVPAGPAVVVVKESSVVSVKESSAVIVELVVGSSVVVGSFVVSVVLVVELVFDIVFVTVLVLVLLAEVVVEVAEAVKKFFSSEHKDHVLHASTLQQPAKPGCPLKLHDHHCFPFSQESACRLRRREPPLAIVSAE